MVTEHNRIRVLKLLSDAHFVSGQLIADKLALSRTAVNKHIKTLKQYGVDIYQVSGKGYKLAKPIQLLDKDTLVAAVKPVYPQLNEENVYYYPIIDSTNEFLVQKRVFEQHNIALCIADYQEHGRGRLGRQWHSTLGANLTFSISYTFHLPINLLSTLSLRTGIAIADAITKTTGVEVGLKWPNDLYYQGLKLGGILIQLISDANGKTAAIIGIGINIASQPLQLTNEYGTTSLNEVAGWSISRTQLLTNILAELTWQFKQLHEPTNDDFIAQWDKYDMLANESLIFIQQHNKQNGVGVGIDANGGYRVRLPDDGVITLYGGEISLRKA